MEEDTKQPYGVNITSQEVTFEIDTVAGKPSRKYKVGPGEKIQLDAGYLFRPPSGNEAGKRASIIEKLTKGAVVPATDPRAAVALARAGKVAVAKPATEPEPAPAEAAVSSSDAVDEIFENAGKSVVRKKS